MAAIVEIAKAVCEAINNRNWNVDCSAVFSYAPDPKLPELQTLHVNVMPLTFTVASSTRIGHVYEYDIGVSIQQRVLDDEQKVEALLDLGSAFADYFLDSKRLAGYSAAHITDVRFEPLYLEEHFREARLFTEVIVLRFRVYS